MVKIGDSYKLQPSHVCKDDRLIEDEMQIGSVDAVYPRFALVLFNGFRECFPLMDLERASRA